MNKKIDLIIQKITGLSKSQLFLNPEIEEKYQKKIDDALYRLKKGEPIEYIINSAEFYSLDFFVNSNVLIPRDDTEIMVDQAIDTIVHIPKEPDKKQNITLIDIGTGSSCIAISILKNTFKVKNTYVTDISQKALEISKKNILKHNLKNNIIQIQGNLLDSFLTHPPSGSSFEKGIKIEKNLIITANLPYIKNNDYKNMDNETIKYEPDIALYGGEETGFELYEKLINQCIELKNIYSTKTIILFIEIGFDQKQTCETFLKNTKLIFSLYNDNQKIERCVKIEF